MAGSLKLKERPYAVLSVKMGDEDSGHVTDVA
jgi:hypothetical protein